MRMIPNMFAFSYVVLISYRATLHSISNQVFWIFQGFAFLPAGMCASSMGRPVSYEQAVAWKVVNDEDSNHCLALMFTNWSFV